MTASQRIFWKMIWINLWLAGWGYQDEGSWSMWSVLGLELLIKFCVQQPSLLNDSSLKLFIEGKIVILKRFKFLVLLGLLADRLGRLIYKSFWFNKNEILKCFQVAMNWLQDTSSWEPTRQELGSRWVNLDTFCMTAEISNLTKLEWEVAGLPAQKWW